MWDGISPGIWTPRKISINFPYIHSGVGGCASKRARTSIDLTNSTASLGAHQTIRETCFPALQAFCVLCAWHIKGSNTMKRSTTLALVTFALLSFALTGNAFAQQKEQASFKATPENSKITQGMNIDVGDAPNHIIRIFEVHRAYPSICQASIRSRSGRRCSPFLDRRW